MTSRERLISVLKGQLPDRVPVSFFVQEEFLSWYYPEKESVRRLEEAVSCARELDFDIMVRGKNFEIPHFMRKSFKNWEVSNHEKVEKDLRYVIFEIKTPAGILKQVEVGPNVAKGVSGIHRSVYEYLIKNESDFKIFSKYVPHIDEETINEMRTYGEYSRKLIGDTGICVPWGWSGVYNQASNYRSVEELMIDAYINEDFYKAYMQLITDLEVEYNSHLADVNIDAIGIQGNIANSALVGKDFFDSYIFPYEKQLVDMIKLKNKFSVYHNCGCAKILLETYVNLGITAWETVAEHPQGDNNLKESKDKVGKDLVLIGNLDQVSFLKKSNPDEVRQKVHDIVSIGKTGGKYIFAASDFLEINTPIENIKAAIEAAKMYGVY